MKIGKFIVVEGIDGSGKSTLCKNITKKLNEKNIPVFLTCEPSNSLYGKTLRESFTKKQRLGLEKELELFILDRREHVEKEIKPAIYEGRTVICDRYYFSTMAYQGALGANPQKIREENERQFPIPDKLIILDIDPLDAILRIKEKRGDTPNNFEKIDYLRKVADIFNSIDEPPDILRLDAKLSPEILTQRALEFINGILSQHP